MTRGTPATLLAARSGVHASNIYAIESGRRRPRIDTIEQIAASLGARVVIVDTDHRASAADVAAQIAADLGRGDSQGATAALLQLANNLRASDPVAAYALSADPPPRVDPEWDAAIAGITEWVLSEKGVPVPAWAAEIDGVPGRRWSPWGEASEDDPIAVDEVPAPLLRRGVLIDSGELDAA